jgi:hypothetical protein
MCEHGNRKERCKECKGQPHTPHGKLKCGVSKSIGHVRPTPDEVRMTRIRVKVEPAAAAAAAVKTKRNFSVGSVRQTPDEVRVTRSIKVKQEAAAANVVDPWAHVDWSDVIRSW